MYSDSTVTVLLHRIVSTHPYCILAAQYNFPLYQKNATNRVILALYIFLAHYYHLLHLITGEKVILSNIKLMIINVLQIMHVFSVLRDISQEVPLGHTDIA